MYDEINNFDFGYEAYTQKDIDDFYDPEPEIDYDARDDAEYDFYKTW